ncbi:50S ribosomal protein L25 [bacterium]|nr:50S ribosomal protein L25 [bacterium]
MGLVNLDIFPRSTKGKNANRRNRAAGRIPAVLYGRDRETSNVELDAHKFSVALTHLHGRTALFALNQEGSTDEITALLREVQRNPVTDMILHVDLMEIPRGVPVTVPVQIVVTGECKAVKNSEASVAHSLDMVEISVRPRDLPEYIEVDISDLEINDKIHAGDLKLPAGELVTDPDQLILNIKAVAVFVEETEEDGEDEDSAEQDKDKESSDD